MKFFQLCHLDGGMCKLFPNATCFGATYECLQKCFYVAVTRRADSSMF